MKDRLEHLIKLCYHSKQYEWQAVLDWHTAVLDEIARGRIGWGDHAVHVETAVLHAHPKSSTTTSTDGAEKNKRKIYCANFQSGKCAKSNPHGGYFAGKYTTLYHFCQSCYVKDRVQKFHSPLSDECPHGPIDTGKDRKANTNTSGPS